MNTTREIGIWFLWRHAKPPTGNATSLLCLARSEEEARTLAAEGTLHPEHPNDESRTRVEPDAADWRDPAHTGARRDVDGASSVSGIVYRDFASVWPNEASPRELYARTPLRVEQDLSTLGFLHWAVPEIQDWHRMPDGSIRELEVRVLADPYIDGERCWVLATVWWDGAPVMIVQEAGRGGRDWQRRFVTDPERYLAMVVGLRRRLPPEACEDVVPLDTPRPDLRHFYSGDVFEAQERDDARARRNLRH